MNIESYDNRSTVTIESNLKIAKVEKDIWVYSLTSSTGKLKSEGTFRMRQGQIANKVNMEGFVNDKNLDLIKRGKNFNKLDLHIMPAAAQEKLRLNSWSELYDDDYRRPDPFSYFNSAGVINPDEIVRPDFSSHMLFNRYGEPLPVAIPFDYISHGGITDGRFDLKKLAAHLLSREDIWIYPKAGGWRNDDVDSKKRAKKINECITDIHYYNQEQGSTQTIYFKWMPTVGDYRKMWKVCLAKEQKYPSTYMYQAIFELDLLGFRKAGAAYYDDYHKSKRYGDTYE